jgi:hypothetical protein
MAVPGVAAVGKAQPKVKVKKGSEKTGQLLGALAGAGLAAATGGAAAPAIIGAAGTGSSLGGLLGGAVDPTSQQVVGQQAPQAAPLQAPRLSSSGEQIKQSLVALQQFEPAFQEQVSFPLASALMKDIQQNNPGMGAQPQAAPQGGLGGLMA